MSTWLFEIDRFDINRAKHSKMQRPSISVIFSIMFLSAIACSIYTVSLLFVPLKCNGEEPCLSSSLITRPRLQLYLFSTTERQPISEDVTLVYSSKKFNYTESQTIPLTLDIPRETRDNGTLYLYIMLIASSQQRTKTFRSLQKDPTLISSVVPLTRYIVPEAEAYHLLEDKNSKKKKKQIIARPVTHLRNKVTFTIMTEDAKIPLYDVPIELKRVMRVNRDHVFLPVVAVDFLQTRHSDFVKLASTDSKMNVTVSYTPISLGKLRLALHVEATVQALTKLGFSEKDVDHIKEIMADTNIYLLPITLFIAAVHMLFDFLAFKNDVSFWRRKDNLVGLSASTVLWRAFSQVVIFLYLLNEGSSLLILIPAGIGTIIEFWKSKKILRAEIIRGNGLIPKIKFNTGESNGAEAQTREFDAESMRYLSYLLCPLVIAGAIYSLLYQSHRSWYSWTINSLVKGVYAFGFLFMLPQLFVNYKLKSVAHLPWKAFMYKACNTFIDDVFAFIITMPVAHRVACFRDDAVFLVYLYQRWLYPVDKSRIDSATIEEEVTIRKVTKKTN